MMKNNKKQKKFPVRLPYLAYIVLCTFLILLISQLVGAACMALLLRVGLISLDTINPVVTATEYLLFISLIFGTILSFIAGKASFRPLKNFIDTTQKVASGDFSVRFQMGPLAESHQLTRSLNSMVEELGSIETLRDDFVSNISHEFKTPVASIHGFAKLLKKGNLSPQQQEEYLDIILSESERLSTLSKNILLLSKLDNTSRMTDMAEYPLDEQLRRTILILNQEMEKKELSLDVTLDSCRITANEEMLSQVWMNLIGNAIKFTPQGGKIGVSLQNTHADAVVTISDNGIGMEPETVKHIFDKFYQGDSSRSCEGNGLGLALVKRITELSGGTIQVESQSGCGSEFKVCLPLAPMEKGVYNAQ